MELCTLHPFQESSVAEFVAAIESDLSLREARDRLVRGGQRDADQLTHALAIFLARREPSFYHPGLSLTGLEARIDRGFGMLMRPPSRLFKDAGFDDLLSRSLPIRLDLSKGMMGGAFIPARLVPQFVELLDSHLERIARRMFDAEWDVATAIASLHALTAHAQSRRLGIYEAMDVVGPGGTALPGMNVVTLESKRIDRDLKARIDAALASPKKPGLVSRLLGRGRAIPTTNGKADGA